MREGGKVEGWKEKGLAPRRNVCGTSSISLLSTIPSFHPSILPPFPLFHVKHLFYFLVPFPILERVVSRTQLRAAILDCIRKSLTHN